MEANNKTKKKTKKPSVTGIKKYRRINRCISLTNK
jgi:hypothetical protein